MVLMYILTMLFKSNFMINRAPFTTIYWIFFPRRSIWLYMICVCKLFLLGKIAIVWKLNAIFVQCCLQKTLSRQCHSHISCCMMPFTTDQKIASKSLDQVFVQCYLQKIASQSLPSLCQMLSAEEDSMHCN